MICEIFFFKILRFTICVFIIFYILFSISSICSCQKILEIFTFCILCILCIRDSIKEFWKIIECFLKKYRHLECKILYKFHRLVFVFFYSFSILVIFFSYFTCPNLSKNFKHFCGALLYGLYILSENSGKLFNFY